MRKRILQTIRGAGLAGALLLLASCAGSSSSDDGGRDQVLALGEGEGALALERRFTMQKGDVEYSEEGAVTGGRRSQYEGRRQIQFGGEWDGERYEKKEFERRSWWGRRAVQREAYDGGEDGSRFQTASRFDGQAAPADGSRSRFDGNRAETGRYATGAAREAGASPVDRPSDAKVDWRRDVFPRPLIIDQDDYAQKSIEQTRGLLGRDD